MKFAPRDNLSAVSAWRLTLALAVAAIVPIPLYAGAPPWWSERDVLLENATADDYAPVNQGQLKNIATAAVSEMDAKLSGGAGDELHALIESWSSSNSAMHDFAPVNLGQLKTVAKPFLDRLISVQYATGYPWTNSVTAPDDFAVANVGQVKQLFSFDLAATDAAHDSDQNGLPDWWERYYFGALGNHSNALAGRGDGLTNLQAFQQGLHPLDYYNGNVPLLLLISGDNQIGPANNFLPLPFVIKVTDGAGNPLNNAPVTFAVTEGGGLLASSSLGGNQSVTVMARTGTDGSASVFYRTPTAANVTSHVTASAGPPGGSTTVVFTTVSTDPITGTAPNLWLKADAGITKDASGRVSTWADQSGRGNDAFQANLASRPLVTSNSINGRPTIRFAGNQWLGLPALMAGAAAGEIFVVLKGEDMPTSSRAVMSFGGGHTSYYPWPDGQIYENFGSSTRYTIGNSSQGLDQYHLYNVSSKSGEWVARINGLVQYATSTNTVFFPSSPFIGRNSSDSSFIGDIAEIIVYDRVLSATERRKVEYYLGGKYPVVAPLPAVPTTLRATAAAASQVSLTWNYDLGNVATQFEIDRKIGTDTYTTIATVSHATIYLDSSVSGGVTYTYRVRAITYSGQSPYSNEASVATPLSGNPLPTSDMRLWLRADSGTSNPLTVWADQSGRSNDAFQANLASRPLVTSNSINGRPTIRFSGNQWLGLPALMNGAAAGEIFVVLRGQDMPTSSRAVMSFGGGHPSYYPWPDGQIYENFGSTIRYTIGNPSQGLDQYHLYNVSSKSGEWVARINGLVQYATSTNTVFFPSSPFIGRNSSDSSFIGDIAEIIVYDRVLNEGERASVLHFLDSQYLIPNLDTDNDGLTNSQEAELGTDPRKMDTNGDGISDGASVRMGIDPVGAGYVWPASPQPPSSTLLSFKLSDPPGAVLLP